MSPEQISKYAGRTITCRKCKQPFAFDAAMDAAAQAAGQAEPEEEEASAATADSVAAEAEADGGQGAYAVGKTHAAPAAPVAAPPPPPRRPAAPPSAPAPSRVEASSYPPASPAPPPAYAQQTYGQPPAAPAGYSPATPGGFSPDAQHDSGVGGIGDLFGFRRMALPALLPLVFWTGVAYCLYNGLRLLLGLVLVTGFHNVPNNPYGNTFGWRTAPYTKLSFDGLFDRLVSVTGLYTVLDALFWLVLGPLFWRGFCELILAASRLLAASERK